MQIAWQERNTLWKNISESFAVVKLQETEGFFSTVAIQQTKTNKNT